MKLAQRRVLLEFAKYLLLASLLGTLPGQSTAAQPYLNLNFETATRGLLWYWYTVSPGYDYTIDTAEFQSGSQSLRVTNVSAASNGRGAAFEQFPVELVRGHHVTITGWMKTVNVTDYASIWWEVDGASGTISNDNMSGIRPSGTTSWTQYQIDRDVSPDATNITLGLFLSGQGTAWFDAIQIQIDGAPFTEGPAPYIGEPTADQVSWVTANAIPVTSATPNQPYDDLMPLKQVIGNARIVALGEATNGTREFFQMKHRIIDFLAKEMGFTIFSIEANMPEAYRLNDYVLNGTGDPVALLKGLYFWTWNTQEVLDMILWMRDFNKSGQGRIQFTGFDMQTPDVAEQIVQDFVAKAEPGYASNVKAAYAPIQQLEAVSQAFGYAADQFPAGVAATKHVKFSAYIKTQGVTLGYAYLYWTCAAANGTSTAFGTSTPLASGTQDWRQVSLELDVPASTASIAFGGVLAGNGTAWFDTYSIEVDGQPYINNAAYDFDFESFFLKSRFISGAGYDIGLDNTVAHTGKQSLRMTYTAPVPSATDLAAASAGIVAHLEASRASYLGQGLAAADVDWALQNARIVAQAEAYGVDSSVRDADMATNIQWIADHSPADAKIVVWAHDFHVSRGAGAMGSYLDARYGKDYVVLGFGFNQGTYNASGSNGVVPFTASPSFPGSFEYVLHQTGTSPFILDLRQASPDNAASTWLLGDLQFRTIGAVPADGFSVTHLVHDYDGIIYFERSTPSTLLPF
jgi:erythromycin esterase-like protein